jgi:hypothetical protein
LYNVHRRGDGVLRCILPRPVGVVKGVRTHISTGFRLHGNALDRRFVWSV